ncbi:chaplin [Actinacidiphila paucisporea]|uniref:Small secreted domain n=1 Tax=Actinacidiphila paucisporea TaxID=310782 RepID=A0A1M7ABX7_9ACTN|nr:chaplin [Actinacidiphila paucisporea]SHL40243.1 Small secreted domain [Actinacidiphila paucisporea]
MNRLTRKGLVSAMVAGGVLASAGYAQADAAAEGDAAGSPGVLSGNSVQVPVHVPVNVCGNTISVVGLLNAVSGNVCANASSGSSAASHAAPGRNGSARPARRAGSAADEPAASGTAGSRSGGGALAAGDTRDSGGVLAGNGLRLPLDLPLNVSGNGVSVIGVGNPSSGNTAVNGETPPPPPAHTPIPAPPGPEQVSPAEATPEAPALAHTGADGVGTAAAGSLAMLLGGTVLYRRARAAGRR